MEVSLPQMKPQGNHQYTASVVTVTYHQHLCSCHDHQRQTWEIYYSRWTCVAYTRKKNIQSEHMFKWHTWLVRSNWLVGCCHLQQRPHPSQQHWYTPHRAVRKLLLEWYNSQYLYSSWSINYTKWPNSQRLVNTLGHVIHNIIALWPLHACFCMDEYVIQIHHVHVLSVE